MLVGTAFHVWKMKRSWRWMEVMAVQCLIIENHTLKMAVLYEFYHNLEEECCRRGEFNHGIL
jgi:hypothetical protein